MGKRAISVTLEADNLLWLKGQAAGSQARGVSEVLDAIVTSARLGGGGPAQARSVVGTIDLPEEDPDLATADAAIQDIFARSIRRPVAVRETSPAYRAGGTRARAKRRG